MIGVIADDFTGAAELAGIGIRYNMNVELSTIVNPGTMADLLVIATDTRSMNEDQATSHAEYITKETLKLKPDSIFKKVDSVLRGHVISELTSQLRVLNLKRALLVPANPTLGRTLVNGIYLYNGDPIHLSSFSNDPEFAIRSSRVLEMLNVEDDSVSVRKTGDPFPDSGIVVGEATTIEDLDAWAKRIDKNILASGASGFFMAILERLNLNTAGIKETTLNSWSEPLLLICGSTFSERRRAIKRIKIDGGPVSYMPEEIMAAKNVEEVKYQKWSREIVSLIKVKGKAIVAIDEDIDQRLSPDVCMLREKTAKVVFEIFREVNIRELLIEGGSTAAAVIKNLGYNTFFPLAEIGTGATRMRVAQNNNLCITVKPGSYEWPPELNPLSFDYA